MQSTATKEAEKSSKKNISLTLWIPTYNRPIELQRLLRKIQQLSLWKYIDIVVSDNASEDWNVFDLDKELLNGIRIERRCFNLSAGANFLRAFEACNTDWIHIVGDDDLLSNTYLSIIEQHIKTSSTSIAAIKFDSELYGHLRTEMHSNLMTALSRTPDSNLNDWFNNLLLISGWLFRRKDICQYVKYAYLGYGTKLSHLLPILSCCEQQNRYILFSSDQPIEYAENQESWPKAASWAEMCINTQLSHGFLSAVHRRALHRCLFDGSKAKLLAKILRIRAFYRSPSSDISWLQVLLIVSCMSMRFASMFLLTLPLLTFPTKVWPQYILKRLGKEGSVHRW